MFKRVRRARPAVVLSPPRSDMRLIPAEAVPATRERARTEYLERVAKNRGVAVQAAAEELAARWYTPRVPTAPGPLEEVLTAAPLVWE